VTGNESGRILLTFNAGSSTVKLGLFALGPQGPRRIGKGMIDFRREPLRFELTEGPDRFDIALEARPGAYLFLGIGPGAGLHHAAYDFNDEAAPIGASFFARLVERAQPLA
jgi:hypothetical protein